MNRRMEVVGRTALVAALLLPGLAGAQGAPRAAMRALVVGSNRGGPGQEDLHFAEDDARRFADVLVEIGGYEPRGVTLLLNPNREQLLSRLDEERGRLQARRDAGEASVFTFYYSGHARSTALSLGNDEVPLGELRQRLLSLPATVRVAILDACQTGAISQIKGATPVGDFSYNSVSDLHAAGAAIMASSTASELSQESEALRSSFFTHYLLVGLRGAADVDLDGRVTLSEAYRYAYHRTLMATASTAVGKQHVTLENDLKGKGEMVLTWPARASAQLDLPAALRAEVVVQKRPGGSVMAEVIKVAGEPMKLALPPGKYLALLRLGESARRCDLALAAGTTTPLLVDGCAEVSLEQATSKVGHADPTPWGIELQGGAIFSRDDGYNRRLTQFGFDGSSGMTISGNLSLTRALGRYLGLVVRFDTLEGSEAKREVAATGAETRTQTFEWQAYGVGAFLRAGVPLVDGAHHAARAARRRAVAGHHALPRQARPARRARDAGRLPARGRGRPRGHAVDPLRLHHPARLHRGAGDEEPDRRRARHGRVELHLRPARGVLGGTREDHALRRARRGAALRRRAGPRATAASSRIRHSTPGAAITCAIGAPTPAWRCNRPPGTARITASRCWAIPRRSRSWWFPPASSRSASSSRP